MRRVTRYEKISLPDFYRDRRAMQRTRAECRSEVIVQSRKLLDIRYPRVYLSSENIFRPG